MQRATFKDRLMVRGVRLRLLVATILVLACSLAAAGPASAWPVMGC